MNAEQRRKQKLIDVKLAMAKRYHNRAKVSGSKPRVKSYMHHAESIASRPSICRPSWANSRGRAGWGGAAGPGCIRRCRVSGELAQGPQVGLGRIAGHLAAGGHNVPRPGLPRSSRPPRPRSTRGVPSRRPYRIEIAGDHRPRAHRRAGLGHGTIQSRSTMSQPSWPMPARSAAYCRRCAAARGAHGVHGLDHLLFVGPHNSS